MLNRLPLGWRLLSMVGFIERLAKVSLGKKHENQNGHCGLAYVREGACDKIVPEFRRLPCPSTIQKPKISDPPDKNPRDIQPRPEHHRNAPIWPFPQAGNP